MNFYARVGGSNGGRAQIYQARRRRPDQGDLAFEVGERCFAGRNVCE